MFMLADLGLTQLLEGSGLLNKDGDEAACYIV